MKWIYLSVAIIAEVIATSALKISQNFNLLFPSIIVLLGYITAFYFLSLSLKTIPIAIAYGIWCGAGMVLISLVGQYYFLERINCLGGLGILLILLGILLLKFSTE